MFYCKSLHVIIRNCTFHRLSKLSLTSIHTKHHCFELGIFRSFTFNVTIGMGMFKSIFHLFSVCPICFLFSFSSFILIPLCVLCELISYSSVFCCFSGCFRVYTTPCKSEIDGTFDLEVTMDSQIVTKVTQRDLFPSSQDTGSLSYETAVQYPRLELILTYHVLFSHVQGYVNPLPSTHRLQPSLSSSPSGYYFIPIPICLLDALLIVTNVLASSSNILNP